MGPVVALLERNRRYRSLRPYGEPQLSRHGLYPTLATQFSSRSVSALMWLLNYADGEHDLLAIAARSGHGFDALAQAAAQAHHAGLVEPL